MSIGFAVWDLKQLWWLGSLISLNWAAGPFLCSVWGLAAVVLAERRICIPILFSDNTMRCQPGPNYLENISGHNFLLGFGRGAGHSAWEILVVGGDAGFLGSWLGSEEVSPNPFQKKRPRVFSAIVWTLLRRLSCSYYFISVVELLSFCLLLSDHLSYREDQAHFHCAQPPLPSQYLLIQLGLLHQTEGSVVLLPKV